MKRKKLGVRQLHRHLKKHLKKHLARYRKFRKRRPHAHKVIVLMSVTIPLILGLVFFGSGSLFLYESYQDQLSEMQKQEITVDLPNVPDDTASWKTYQDAATKFSVKYIPRWDEPKVDTGSGKKYERKITFSNGLDAASEQFKGFEVYVYNANLYPGPAKTGNLVPKEDTYQKNRCDQLEFPEAVVGEGDYPAQEVEVDSQNRCFGEAYFFSVTRGGYTYNIVPLVNFKGDNPFGGGKKSEVILGFPKFFEILSTVVIPEPEKSKAEEPTKPTVSQKVIKKAVEPKPKRVLVSKASCAKKNHKGKKSKTKGRHMDEDCCMDPDESPNPRCQY
ncbi:MAG: hypothetical protein FJZ04_00710 [Candidatus Moranbacteria bacterium]|nr:hypothetical protein [Candidatus Moranbacteria bacterium]